MTPEQVRALDVREVVAGLALLVLEADRRGLDVRRIVDLTLEDDGEGQP